MRDDYLDVVVQVEIRPIAGSWWIEAVDIRGHSHTHVYDVQKAEPGFSHRFVSVKVSCCPTRRL